jgi:methionine synthase II (cobalamin-independent)
VDQQPLFKDYGHDVPETYFSAMLRADDFIDRFSQDGMPGCARKLMTLLDEAQDIIRILTQAVSVSAFLGHMHMDENAVNDNDILEQADAMEADVSYLEKLCTHVTEIEQRLVRVLSRSTFL